MSEPHTLLWAGARRRRSRVCYVCATKDSTLRCAATFHRKGNVFIMHARPTNGPNLAYGIPLAPLPRHVVDETWAPQQVGVRRNLQLLMKSL